MNKKIFFVLCAITTASNAMEMEPLKPVKKHLKFIVQFIDNKFIFKGASAKNMEYYIKKPEDFLNKDLLTVLPLTPKDSTEVSLAILQAMCAQEERKVRYSLDSVLYKAKINPFIAAENNPQVLIKVKYVE